MVRFRHEKFKKNCQAITINRRLYKETPICFIMGLKRGLQYLVGLGSLIGLIGCGSIKLETDRYHNYYRENEFEKIDVYDIDRFPVVTLFSFTLGSNKNEKAREKSSLSSDLDNMDYNVLNGLKIDFSEDFR